MLENENTEFKVQFTDKIYKETIAFINTNGGKIYIGIDDEGNRIGVDNVDDTYTRITNGIRDNISPDPTLFIKYILHEDNVIEIDITEGSNKPYYLKSKGLKSSGVFIRQGTSKVEASMDQIRHMIKVSDGDHYEEERSLNQNLTFKSMRGAFDKYDVDYNASSEVNLGLKNLKDGMYTNLGLLLSDQCEHTVKVAIFEDEENTVFHSRKEFSGSLFDLLSQTYEFLMLNNNNSATIKGLKRIDSKDYPDEAIREVLLNAIVHRDYSYSGSIIVNLNKTKLEVISIGGLLPGLVIEDIKNGVSQSRNSKLADVFYRLKLIESYGTGIRRIFKLYKDCHLQPELDVTQNSFKITLPNMKTGANDMLSNLTNQEKLIIELLRENDTITDRQLQDILKIKQSRSYGLTKQLYEKGLIEIIGKGEGRLYKIK